MQQTIILLCMEITQLPFVIAIDGPAASGKSTIAKKVADYFHITHLNSGQMYRFIAYIGLTEGIPPSAEKELSFRLTDLAFQIKNNALYCNDQLLAPLTDQATVEHIVSEYAKIPSVRQILTDKQRELAQQYPLIIDGRDIGTTVFPETPYKFFLTSSLEVRAKRRFDDFNKSAANQGLLKLENIYSELERRDSIDKSRSISPLRQAETAIYIDSSMLSVEETVQAILVHLR